MEDTTQNIAATMLEAGCALSSEIHVIAAGGKPYQVVPENYRIEKLEELLPYPTRKTGNVVTTDTASFVAYTKKHGSLDDCTIYANIDTESSKCHLVAVINDHGADQPKWQDYRCEYAPKLAVEWKRWLGSNRKEMNQASFATWLEDNLADIASVPNMPTGADMLTMALGFEANAEKRVVSKINLQNGGVQFQFVEDEAKETRSSMKVFERFTLGIPVFDGSTAAYPIEARLKYREKSGSLTFWYELIRPDRVFKTAVTDELAIIKEATGFAILAGRVE